MKPRAVAVALSAALLLPITAPPSAAQDARTVHAIAMHGDPKYGPDFEHFDYVNPDAPKGGTITYGAIGTFDSLNPLILKGTPAAGSALPFETLLVSSADEAFTMYGLVAEAVTVPEDRSWVAFSLRPEARWHDGEPITVEDVIFSFNTLKEMGHPFYRAYYANVEKAEEVGEREVRFTFGGGDNRELPLIIGQMPILPQHYWAERDFAQTTLEPPLGSGPYEIESVDSGRSITLKRVEDYWGEDLPVNVGQNNFERIRYEYYRDSNVALQALFAGSIDFRLENTAKLWATAYDVPPVRDGRIVKEAIPNELPTGMQGFAYNIRREVFKDPRVRQALAHAFDFEWTNETLFYGQYTRTESYFSNSELASRGLPTGMELEILEQFRGHIPEEVFTQEYQPPSTDDAGGLRANLLKAVELLEDAGWVVEDGRRVNAETGRPFEFEVLLNNPDFERIVQPFVQNLARLGITARIRTVDTAQYENRMNSFDFDMTVEVFGQSLSPGNEQRDFWSSEAAETPGSRNTIGISDPVIDELINLVISAPDRESLVARTRALDRVLLWGHYVIPHWHIQSFRVAYWNKFSHPEVTPPYGPPPIGWWVDSEKLAELRNEGTSD